MQETANGCIEKIKQIDFSKLGLSDYNQLYINRIVPHLAYYFTIYIQSISSFSRLTKESWIVDFGGGHGFLSLFLKSLGYNVIYCDINPLSVKTITLIKDEINIGPDYIVSGSTEDLKQFCELHDIMPTHLIATDLIEHIYDLSDFFRNLRDINPDLEMVFTTGSNPKNSYKCKQLHKYMVEEEKVYLSQRKEFISKHFAELTEAEIENLAKLSRGKIYPDIQPLVTNYKENGVLPIPLSDQYNTCDPENGNWTERILPLEEYQRLATENGFQTVFKPGFYNEKRSKSYVSQIVHLLNSAIRKGGETGYKLAPYILIKLYRNNG